MLYFVCEKERENSMVKNKMGFFLIQKYTKNINLYSCMCYSSRDINRIANARYSIVDIPKTITHKTMQINY